MESKVEKKQNIPNNKVYLCGKEIMGRKTVLYALQTIYGIGLTRAQYICKWIEHHYNIASNYYIGNVSDNIIKAINDFVSTTFLTEGDLKKIIDQNIELKIKIQCREGRRLKLGLSLKGRTKSNSQTARKRKKV